MRRCPLPQLLLGCMQKPLLSCLAAQLVQQLSVILEMILGKKSKQPMKEQKSALKFVWQDDCKDGGGVPPSRYVCQYVMNGIEELSMHDFPGCLSFATDKGWARTLPLQVTIIGAPSGKAVLAIPQVASLEGSGVLNRTLPKFTKTGRNQVRQECFSLSQPPWGAPVVNFLCVLRGAENLRFTAM
eukprot:9392335-Lingulodinium_polyedra.AAC.1